MVFKKFSWTLTRPSISWLMLIQFAFWSSVNTRGTNFAATRCMLIFSVRIAWHDPKLMPTSSAISLIVKRQFWRIKSRTASMWTSSVGVEGRPLRGSSSIDVLPVLKWLRSARTFVSVGLLKHFTRFSSSFPEFEAKFHTRTRCSSKSLIFTA